MGKQPQRKEIIATLTKKYPKFSKVTASMVAHPERYGVCLTPEAKAYLREAYPPKEKKPCYRSKTNMVSVRLTDWDFMRFKKAYEESGEKSVQDYLEKIIGRELDGMD